MMHVIAAKAVCFKEAMADSFVAYQEKTIQNAKTLAGGLLLVDMTLYPEEPTITCFCSISV